MDQLKITEERSTVPNWAAPEAGSARAVTEEAIAGVPKISEPQRRYLLSLIEQKQIKPEQEGKIDLIMKCLRISEDPEEYGMSRDKASELISWFVKQPDKPQPDKTRGGGTGGAADRNEERLQMGVPAGRYAVEADNGELRFYKVWVSRDKSRLNVYVQHGPDESDLWYQPRTLGVLRKIKEYGIRESAIRYGMEIGECSNCGRRLTNRISRELGIGPICGGRMFGDDFKAEVKGKRDELRQRGLDPDEVIT